MTRLLLAIALLACTLAPAFSGAAAGAGQESAFRIAFLPPGAASLCVMDATTEAQACLTHDLEGVTLLDLAWSPDGTMIAASFARHADGTQNGGVLVFAADGSRSLAPGGIAPRAVLEGAFGRPMWSPDSRRVASPGPGGIVIHDLEDGATRTIGPAAVSPSAAAWSPDGSTFAVAVRDGAGVEIVAVDASDGSTSVLHAFAAAGSVDTSVNGLSWSPDAERILLTRAIPDGAPSTGTRSQHWLLDADDGDATMFYESPRSDGPVMEAAFSPRGDFIAFDGYAGGRLAVFRADARGQDQRQMSAPGTDSWRPRWEPQLGEHLLHMESDGTSSVSVITPAGGVLQQGTYRRLPLMISAEWAPRPGLLPPGAVAPPPQVAETPLSPPSAATPVASVPTPARIGAPDTGSGPVSHHGVPAAVIAITVAVVTGAGAFIAVQRVR